MAQHGTARHSTGTGHHGTGRAAWQGRRQSTSASAGGMFAHRLAQRQCSCCALAVALITSTHRLTHPKHQPNPLPRRHAMANNTATAAAAAAQPSAPCRRCCCSCCCSCSCFCSCFCFCSCSCCLIDVQTTHMPLPPLGVAGARFINTFLPSVCVCTRTAKLVRG